MGHRTHQRAIAFGPSIERPGLFDGIDRSPALVAEGLDGSLGRLTNVKRVRGVPPCVLVAHYVEVELFLLVRLDLLI